MPSLAKCLFRSSAHVLIGLLVVFVCVSLYVFVGFFDIELYELFILEIKPLSVTSSANIFSHSVGCLFILFMVSFGVQKLISLIWSHLFIFVFISFALRD